jgi:hypothetical protein
MIVEGAVGDGKKIHCKFCRKEISVLYIHCIIGHNTICGSVRRILVPSACPCSYPVESHSGHATPCFVHNYDQTITDSARLDGSDRSAKHAVIIV